MDTQKILELQSAVECALNPSSSPDVKDVAIKYCENLLTRPDGWTLCVQVFLQGSNQSSNVRHYCLHVIEDFINTRWSLMKTEEHLALRDALWNWLANSMDDSEPSFIRNKFAHTLVRLFRLEYPENWPDFFGQLLNLLDPSLIPNIRLDMFLRICSTIDEEIASLQINRSPEETSRNAIIKDAMRLDAIPRLVPVWKAIVNQHPNSNYVNIILRLFGSYISWIDVNLVYPEWMNVVYSYLSQANTRDASLEFLAELVHKGMKSQAKIAMLSSLDLPRVLQSMEPNEAFAKLVNTAGAELCELMEEAAFDQTAVNLMDALIPSLCRSMIVLDDDSHQIVLPFLSSYFTVLKRLKKMNSPVKSQHVGLVFEALLQRCKYEADVTSFGPIFDQTDGDEFLETRKILKSHLEGIATVDLGLFSRALTEYVHGILDRISNKQSVPWTDAELALFLVYIYQDCVKSLPEYGLTSPLGGMLAKVVTSGIALYPHASIPPIFFELLARHVTFFDANPSLISPALQAFVGPRGLHNPNSQIRPRICTLFLRFVKTIKTRLIDYVPDLLNNMQDLVAIVPNQPSIDGLLDLFEAMGHLLSIDNSSQMTQAVLQPYLNMVQTILQNQSYLTDVAPENTYTTQISRIVSAMGSFARGFPDYDKVRMVPWIDGFKNALEATLATLSTLGDRAMVREACKFALQRIVGVIGPVAEPYLGHLMSMQVLAQCDATETAEYLSFFGLLNHKFKPKQATNDTLLEITRHTIQHLSQPRLGTDDVSQQRELRRAYLSYLVSIFNNDMADVFSSPNNLPHLAMILDIVIQAAGDVEDGQNQKIALNILTKAVNLWCKDGITGFDQYAIASILPVSFAPFRSGFTFNDAATQNVLGETFGLHKALMQALGSNFDQQVKQNIFPNITSAEGYLESLKNSIEFKTFRRHFQTLKSSSK